MTVQRGFKSPKLAIAFDPDSCAGCGICELVCALFREGAGGPALSRCRLMREPFDGKHTFSVCRQCLAPSCYAACPLSDRALCIDPDTGVKFVNADECAGCGECGNACPFDPPQIRVSPHGKTSLKCDLCRGMSDGPVCAAYCPMGALQVIHAKKREKEE